jgi:hypothetical protein
MTENEILLTQTTPQRTRVSHSPPHQSIEKAIFCHFCESGLKRPTERSLRIAANRVGSQLPRLELFVSHVKTRFMNLLTTINPTTVSRWLSAILAILGLVLALISLGGCVSKSKADAQARIAYLQGQQQAMIRMQQSQQPITGAAVTVVGSVQNPTVAWKPGLMLSQAIVLSRYSAPTDPTRIVIRRSELEIPIDPQNLLKGEDFLLEAGDVIEIQQ